MEATVWNRPLYLVTGEMPVATPAMPRTVQAKMMELRRALQSLVEEAKQIENDMLQLAVEGTLREYGETWRAVDREAPDAWLDATLKKNPETNPDSFVLQQMDDEAIENSRRAAVEQRHMILDVLTRSALNSLPVQVVSREEFDLLLRKHTMIHLDTIVQMCDSFDRLAAR